MNHVIKAWLQLRTIRPRSLIVYLVAMILLLVIRESGLSESVNLYLYDLAVEYRPTPSGASTPVRLVGIDEADLKLFGPVISDGHLADAIERLDQIGVSVIGLDLFCDQPLGAGSSRLRQLAANNPRLVSTYYEADGKQAIPGTPIHRQGYADLYTDPQDGVMRRDLIQYNSVTSLNKASLPMRLLQIYHGNRNLQNSLQQRPDSLIRLEKGSGGYHYHAATGEYPYLIQMLAYHQPGSFPQWNLRKLLRNQLSAKDRHQLQGSIILIGITAPSARDQYVVPYSRWRRSEKQFMLSGVEIHAHRLASLLALGSGQQLGIQAASPLLNGWILLVAVTCGLMAGEGITNLRRSKMVVGVLLVLAMGSTALMLFIGVWLDAALPMAALALMAAAAWIRRGTVQDIKGSQLESERRRLRNLFDRYLSEQVADTLLAEDQAGEFFGELCDVTVLVSDLRGFSELSEHQEPGTTTRLLNSYLEAMFKIIEQYDGTIDDVIGDSILVLFGAPRRHQDHSRAAVSCALSMQNGMIEFNHRNRQNGLPSLDMGIGLCTGEVYAGTIGTSRRAKYSVVGPAVNMATRIEALTVGGEIFADASTIQAVATGLRLDADYSVQPKGSSENLKIYSIGAIDSPQQIALPAPHPLFHVLTTPLEVHFSIMNGKQREGLLWVAQINQISSRQFWMSTDQPKLEMFDNVIVRFPNSKLEAFGKIREKGKGEYRVALSTLTEETRVLLQKLQDADSMNQTE